MKPEKLPDFSQVRSETGDLLAQNGNRLLLVECIVLLLPLVALYVIFHTAFVSAFSYELQGNDAQMALLLQISYVFMLSLLTLFFTLPMLVGLFRTAHRIERGDVAVPADVFSSFSSFQAYTRSLRLSYGFFWRLGLIVLVLYQTFYWTTYFFAGSLIAGCVCGVVMFLELGIGLLLCAKKFSVLFFALEYGELPMHTVHRYAHQMNSSCLGGVRFLLGFLPWFLLSFLTIGILLLADVLPRAMLAYFRFCRVWHERMCNGQCPDEIKTFTFDEQTRKDIYLS